MKFTNIKFENRTPVELVGTAIPTLGELYQEFKKKGSVRKDILANQWKGEWTATWLLDGQTLIERPTRVYQDNDVWKIEGGKRIRIKVPEDGWVTAYGRHGFPTKIGTKEEAVKKFGKDASYFWVGREGLRPMLRYFLSDHGPFRLDAPWHPDARHSHVGARSAVGAKISVSKADINEAYQNGWNDAIEKIKSATE